VLAITGQAPGFQVNEAESAVLLARSTLKTFENDLARGLVINERFPVREREAVLDALDLSPALWDNPSAMRVRIRAADKAFRIRVAQFERDAKDQSLAPAERAKIKANVAVMKNAIDRLGVPRSEILEGLTVEGVNAMTAKDVALIYDVVSAAELTSLSGDVGRALIPKLREAGKIE
jgi:hypothetical protein